MVCFETRDDSGRSATRLRLEDAEDVVLAKDEALLAVDLHLGPAVLAEEHAVARPSTSSLRTVPSSRTLPLPTAITSPSIGFSLAVSGMMIPPLLFSSS